MPFFGRSHFGFIALSGIVILAVFVAVARLTTPFGPLAYYPLAGLGFAALALGFWRLERRFGARALAAALSVICIYGAIRDHRVAERTGLLEFAAGFPVAIADGVLEWGVPFLVAVALSARAFRGRKGATP